MNTFRQVPFMVTIRRKIECGAFFGHFTLQVARQNWQEIAAFSPEVQNVARLAVGHKKIPARGLKLTVRAFIIGIYYGVGHKKIPARGLKPIVRTAPRGVVR